MAMNARLWQPKRRLSRPCLCSAWAERFPFPLSVFPSKEPHSPGSPHTTAPRRDHPTRARHGPAPARGGCGSSGPGGRAGLAGPRCAPAPPRLPRAPRCLLPAPPPGRHHRDPSGSAASRGRGAHRGGGERSCGSRPEAEVGAGALAASAGGGRPFLLRLPAGRAPRPGAAEGCGSVRPGHPGGALGGCPNPLPVSPARLSLRSRLDLGSDSCAPVAGRVVAGHCFVHGIRGRCDAFQVSLQREVPCVGISGLGPSPAELCELVVASALLCAAAAASPLALGILLLFAWQLLMQIAALCPCFANTFPEPE